MINKETGRIIIRDDLIIYPGMTKEEFIKSKLFNEVDNYESENAEKSEMFDLKTQIIDEYPMLITIFFMGEIISEVEIFHEDAVKWIRIQKIIEEDFYRVKRIHDGILEKDLGVKIGDAYPYGYTFRCDWGTVTSLIEFKTPSVGIIIRYY